ncbi:MAG: SMC-Scp complex subunit ScpB [Alcanivoracaceae bacterium]|jgi:segregation and condensation protein B|nr:SMC-Scp complex subunit ScpB [Alcanivoracaceae bacterium]
MTDESQTTETVEEEQDTGATAEQEAAPKDAVDAEAADAGPADEADDGEAGADVPKADVDNTALDEVLVRQVLEGAILVADGPLNRDGMLMLFDEAERPSRRQLNELLETLAADYEKRGIELREVASGFRFQVRKELGPWVSRMWQEKPPRYSRAIMETLALIAYRQPITRGEIEEIRGVSVNTQIVRTLLERGWVRVVGHRDVPGRPAMYATTRGFLDYFDLKSLEDLPPLSEIKDLDKLNEELQLAETAQLADEAHESAHAGDGEGGEGAADPERQQSLMEQMEQEPEIDESTLMSLDQVDQVLAGFESEFRKKDGKGKKGEQQAQADAEQTGPSALAGINADQDDREDAPAEDSGDAGQASRDE